MFISVIDAHEYIEVVIVGIPNEFIKTKIPTNTSRYYYRYLWILYTI